MTEKQKFQEVLKEIRKDLEHILELYNLLGSKARIEEYKVSQELKEWIYDTFMDKIYETNAKIKRFITEANVGTSLLGSLDCKLVEIKSWSEIVSREHFMVPYGLLEALEHLKSSIDEYILEVESIMGFIRMRMHETEWKPLEKLKTEDYLVGEKRAKFVKARDELENAKRAIKDKRWDDILNHLRTAIDLAIKERFSFQKIQPMRQFLEDADKYDFPLPSYTMLYDFFDEGSNRIHGGKIHTPWECQKALGFVTDFIDRLDLIDVSLKQIEDFKKKCKAVS